MNSKKLIPYLIVVVPLALILILGFSITTFYVNKLNNYFDQAKEKSIKEYVRAQKAESQQLVSQLVLLLTYTNNLLEPQIQKKLKREVDTAYMVAHQIQKQYAQKLSAKQIQAKIKKRIENLIYGEKFKSIFLIDYRSNVQLKGSHKVYGDISHYLDAQDRAIVLEEIQKVRKSGSGYILSRHRENDEEEMIYVKNLNMYDLYIGTSEDMSVEKNILKRDLLHMIKSMPIDSNEFIGVYEGKKKLYNSENFSVEISDLDTDGKWHKHAIKNHYYFSQYYKKFNWTILHGFDTTYMSKSALNKQKELKEMLDKELAFIIKASLVIIFIVLILSLVLSLRINKIFKAYQKELEEHSQKLSDLNRSLEVRVKKEVEEHRQKDKLLAQSTKMAEMGDMISMIAHQWRQPLNQMSYVVMNIELAYEYEELTQEYLQDKVKEANTLLEFKSQTIEDFRSYFTPDKQKSLVAIKDVVEQSLSLIQKAVESSGVLILCEYEFNAEVQLYKNEFIQVLLNLIKNAKDALVEVNTQNKTITIKTYEKAQKLFVEVSDNGLGIKPELLEKIYEPYFSTKDAKTGTGLGLYMSKMIIEGHLGGKISVKNKEEGGASFTIELPL